MDDRSAEDDTKLYLRYLNLFSRVRLVQACPMLPLGEVTLPSKTDSPIEAIATALAISDATDPDFNGPCLIEIFTTRVHEHITPPGVGDIDGHTKFPIHLSILDIEEVLECLQASHSVGHDIYQDVRNQIIRQTVEGGTEVLEVEAARLARLADDAAESKETTH